MRSLFAAICVFFVAFQAFAQENYEFDNFTVTVKDNIVLAKTVSGEQFYSRSFDNVKEFLADLDGDSIPEFCVTVVNTIKNNDYYKIYVYNTVDTFNLSDSLESLNIEPYSFTDDETGKEIFVRGNPEIEKIFPNSNEQLSAPIDCFEFDGANFIFANDDQYDAFMEENEDLIDSLDGFYNLNPQNCDNSRKEESLIASIYLNYKNAYEDSISLHFMNKYYFCNDVKELITKLNGLLKVKKHEAELE